MTRPLLLLSALLFTSLSCGDEDNDGDSGPDSASNTNGESGGTNPSTTTSTSSTSSTTCVSDHGCIGDVCTCETPGLEDMPCTNETLCEEECEICM